MTTPPLTWPDLVWSHFSRPRFEDFETRIKAASAAGYAGVGIYIHLWARLREQGWSPADIVRFAADHGIRIAEIEIARGWWATDGPAAETFAADEALIFEIADATGAQYLQAVGPYECSFAQAVDQFGQFCDRAGDHGLRVGIEWLPFTNITTEADAQRLIEAVDRPNAGYCADIWHHRRGSNNQALLDALPADRIFCIQMNDGLMQPTFDDYKVDCLASRLPPGDGEFDCVSFLRSLRDRGVNAPLSVEVCSTDMWAMPAKQAAKLSADGIRAVLARLAETAPC